MLLQTDGIRTKLQAVLAHLNRVNVVELLRHGRVLPRLREPAAEVNLVDQFLFGVLQVLLEVVGVHAVVFIVFKRHDFILVHIGSLLGFVFLLR